MTRENIHFVTGRLAHHALKRIVPDLADEVGFDYSIDVLPITVAALMTPAWIAERIDVGSAATRVIIPGYCDGDLTPVSHATGLPVERGPRDLQRLPAHFACKSAPTDYGGYDVEIIAEINHCPRLTLSDIRDQVGPCARCEMTVTVCRSIVLIQEKSNLPWGPVLSWYSASTVPIASTPLIGAWK